MIRPCYNHHDVLAEATALLEQDYEDAVGPLHPQDSHSRPRLGFIGLEGNSALFADFNGKRQSIHSCAIPAVFNYLRSSVFERVAPEYAYIIAARAILSKSRLA